MTDSGYTHHVLVLDRSGSMGDPAEPGSSATKADIATKGIANYVRDQAGNSRATFTVYQFDTTGIDKIADFADTVNWQCKPRAGTPLRDALGTAIAQTGEALEAMPEGKRPGRVYVVVVTDGLENASREYTAQRIKDMVTEQTGKYGWDFIYLGADLDAFAEGHKLGVNVNSTLGTNTVAPNAYLNSFTVASAAVTRATAGGQSVTYTAAERKAAQGE